MNPESHHGNSNPLLVVSILLGVLVVGLGVFSTWAFMNYSEQKNNVDGIVSKAVEAAKKEQTDADEKSFLEREKKPTRKLTGPSDLGSVSFEYPKTWSVYIDKDGSGGTYTSFLNPGEVNSAGQKATSNALVVSVETKDYAGVLKSFDPLVTKGDLKATPVKVGDQQGTRLDGTFSKDVQGASVLFKLRDKTLKITVQSNDYISDFNNIVLTSLKFNP
jgi:hypothetical protein